MGNNDEEMKNGYNGDEPEAADFDDENPLEDAPLRRPSTPIRVIALVLVLGLIGLYALRPSTGGGRRSTGPFELTPVRASDETIESEALRGRPVVLNFWASWCGPCRREMPLFEEAWRTYRGQGLLVVGIDVKDAPDSALEFLNQVDVTYPVVRDEEEALIGALGITTGLPQTYFLRPDGEALDALLEGRIDDGGSLVIGEMSAEELESHIQELLAGSSA